MPSAAPRVCPRCQAVVSGRCIACAADRRRAHDATRPTAVDRGYDAEWRKLRCAFLKRHPACTHPGCQAQASEVDHIRTVREAPELRLSWSNLRALCRHHHSQRTMREVRARQGHARNFHKGPVTDRGPQRVVFSNSPSGLVRVP